jgi:chemotaxis receptor (MCP) glutamine deamidase CheD
MTTPEVLKEPAVVTVPYGEAAVIPVDQAIQTKGLYSCLGVILLDEKNVALAHMPATEQFAVLDESIPGYVTAYPRTFGQLTEKLLRLYGTKTRSTRAYIVGGMDQSSEDLAEKMTRELVRWGLRKEKITRWGPHDKEIAWDLTVCRGKVFITTKQAFLSKREGGS